MLTINIVSLMITIFIVTDLNITVEAATKTGYWSRQ